MFLGRAKRNNEVHAKMMNGGETNVKDMFKHSMGKGKDEILKNGAGTDDVRKFLFFSYVMHLFTIHITSLILSVVRFRFALHPILFFNTTHFFTSHHTNKKKNKN